jgi:hypothetical protein
MRTQADAKYPKNHKAGMAVPRGGSNCAKCAYLVDAQKKICGEPNFIAWNGSKFIPGEIDSYCSDWFEAKKEQPRQRFENVRDSSKE